MFRRSGLVVAPALLKELGLLPLRQTPIDTGQVAEIIGSELPSPLSLIPGPSSNRFSAGKRATSPARPAVRPFRMNCSSRSRSMAPRFGRHGLSPSSATAIAAGSFSSAIEAPGVDPDARNALDGWEATPHQRFERLLRDTGVFAGLLISERDERKDGEVRYYPEFRLIYAPRGETSGHQSFPIRPMAMVAGRPMLGGLKLLLDRFRLFSDADDRRLPALLKHSRDAQASVSTALAEQVLGALHELLARFGQPPSRRSSANSRRAVLIISMRGC